MNYVKEGMGHAAGGCLFKILQFIGIIILCAMAYACTQQEIEDKKNEYEYYSINR